MELLVTTLQDVEHKSGQYPVALGNAASLLIEEQRNFVPIYMPGAAVNLLEAKVNAARASEGEVGEVIESLNAGMAIHAFRGQVRRMTREMAQEWGSSYAIGFLLVNDALSSNPAITKPEDPLFSFQFRPKTFVLGSTGRLLEDEIGRRYQERLLLKLDIYDAFNLATGLRPQRVIAVDNHGNQTVIHEDGKAIGNKERLDKPGGRVMYVFDEARREEWGLEELQVLPTNGFRVVFSDFYEKIKKYERGAILFGHRYSSAGEFLERARIIDQHLIWDICANFSTQYRGLDAPLIDCERVYGIENSYGKKFPEHKNRLQLISNRVDLYFERVSLHFDRSTAIQALMSLGDIITDIWFEPVDRRWDQGWDIVYNKRMGITPDKPVAVIGTANIERYPVLKGYLR